MVFGQALYRSMLVVVRYVARLDCKATFENPLSLSRGKRELCCVINPDYYKHVR